MKFTLTCALLFAALANGQEQAVSPADREAHWREDLKFLTAGLSASGTAIDFQRGISSRGQKDFAKLYPAAKWDAAMESITAAIPKLTDAEIVLDLMRLIGSANVAHNTVSMPVAMGFFSRLPLDFQWFSDGLAVIGAAPDYSAALGAHVLEMGGRTPEQLAADLAPYIPHENDAWLHARLPEFLRPRAVLQHLRLTDAAGSVVLRLQKPGGEPFTLTVPTRDPRTQLLPVTQALRIPTPLFRSHPDKYYWYEYLADSQTLFIQYNRCSNDPKQPFADFAREALAAADAHEVRRVVIDLRQNSGGNSRVINPLKSGLAARSKKVGPVYVLIGPITFSSAVDNALELRHSLHAKLVGEPGGGKPASYGEVKTLVLPNSKLRVQYTSKYFGTSKETDTAALQPDIPAPRTLADMLAGRDPALEAAK